VRFETPAGEQAQVDFARIDVQFVDEPGVKRIIWLLSMVLGYSRPIWARFVVSKQCFAVISGLGDRLLRRPLLFRPGQRRARMEANMPVVVSMMVTACWVLPCPNGYLLH
jgi:hypothetical protein